ncbi:MAG: hypothetical protein ACJ0BT_03600 [Pseudohongiellaceae bacterium]
MAIKLTKFLILTGILLTQACTTTDDIELQQSEKTDLGNPEGNNVELLNSSRISDPFLKARILADMLFEASIAFEDNRLLLPAGDNAYDRYLEVLSFDPDNQVALQGIQDIVDRYIAMATQAMEIGQFDNAEEYLKRADSISPGVSNIIEVRRVLNLQQSVSREYFPLDPHELSAQSLIIMSQLGSIGEFVRNYDATFLITARSDAEARWIYQVMREAVGGYRLRGNIALGSQPTIQVNIPQT